MFFLVFLNFSFTLLLCAPLFSFYHSFTHFLHLFRLDTLPVGLFVTEASSSLSVPVACRNILAWRGHRVIGFIPVETGLSRVRTGSAESWNPKAFDYTALFPRRLSNALSSDNYVDEAVSYDNVAEDCYLSLPFPLSYLAKKEAGRIYLAFPRGFTLFRLTFSYQARFSTKYHFFLFQWIQKPRRQ